jgi:hypothetical protein
VSDKTPRLGLPYLTSSQSQKEIVHNEALNVSDALIQIAVESMALTTAPTGIEGNLYIVASGATGTWSGYDNYLVQYIGGTWVFYTPFEGLRVWNKASGSIGAYVYKSSSWQSEITANSKLGFFSTTPVTKTTVTMSNTDGVIGGLTISSTYSQSEVQALRNGAETLADDVRAIKTALSSYGLI